MDLIEAFRQSGLVDWQLAIVGAADHPDDYARRILNIAAGTPGVVCTGFQSGQALHELYAHAGLFALPSSHEGLPIAMLEALSYGLPVIASAIPANLELGLPEENYFPLGDVTALAKKLYTFAARPLTLDSRETRRAWVRSRFDWNDIASQTMAVYRAVLCSRWV